MVKRCCDQNNKIAAKRVTGSITKQPKLLKKEKGVKPKRSTTSNTEALAILYKTGLPGEGVFRSVRSGRRP